MPKPCQTRSGFGYGRMRANGVLLVVLRNLFFAVAFVAKELQVLRIDEEFVRSSMRLDMIDMHLPIFE